MASAYALTMFSGKIILNFGVQKRLRAFLNPIFMERGRNRERQLPRWFPAETAARRGKYPFRHRLRRCHLPQGDGFSHCRQVSLFTKGVPLGELALRSKD